MNEALSNVGRAHRVVLALCALGVAALQASCGGEEGVADTKRQQAQAATLDKAMTLAKSTNAAKMRGERAPPARP